MHRCGGPCTCTEYQTNSAFSMLFSTHHKTTSSYDHDPDQMYYSSSSSHVDCTLSLGTPSTRSSHATASCISNFCFDILHSKNTPPPTLPCYNTTTTATTTNDNNTDSLVARRCANCDTTSTPLWRNGPRGPKSLCNACGIRFKKEERRASAAACTTTTSSSTTANSNNSNGVNTWAVHHQQYSQQQSQKMHCISSPGNEQFRFIEDDQSADNTIPFLSWRLNVTDRPSLIHDFTR